MTGSKKSDKKSDTLTLTRRIEIRVCKDERYEESWEYLRNLNYDVYKALNKAITLQHTYKPLLKTLKTFVQKKDKSELTRQEAIEKNRYMNIVKETLEIEKGFSPSTPIGALLGSEFPNIPSAVIASLDQTALAHYQADIKNGFPYKRSLRTYKLGYPIPVRYIDLGSKFDYDPEEQEYFFSVFGRTQDGKRIPGIKFYTVNSSKDASNSSELYKVLRDRDYLSDSAIQIKGTKVYLLMVVKVKKIKKALDKKLIVGVDLGLSIPAVAALSEGFGVKKMGNWKSFAGKRIGFQKQYRKEMGRVVIGGGHGRQGVDKFQDRFSEKERNFAKNFNHNISREIIEFAIHNGAGIIKLENLSFGKKNADGEIDSASIRIMRNWSYAELQSQIEYKAKRYGIEVVYINPYHTSKTCSKCGWVDPMSKEEHKKHPEIKEGRYTQATFYCITCKEAMNADVNAAINIARNTNIVTKKEESQNKANAKLSTKIGTKANAKKTTSNKK